MLHNRNEVDPLTRWQSAFFRGHRAVIRINPLWIQKQIFAREFGFLRVGRECARDQFDLSVQSHRHAMNATDERVPAAAHHASI